MFILAIKYLKSVDKNEYEFSLSYRKQPADERCRRENSEYIFELHTERIS
jgi:hypothetical protein